MPSHESQGESVIINKADIDPAVHRLWPQETPTEASTSGGLSDANKADTSAKKPKAK
jgi:hypothetical protein